MISIRSILWAFNLLMLAAVAYASSLMAAGMLERRLVEQMPLTKQKQPRQKDRTVRKKVQFKDYQAILDVNMFKARRTSLSGAPSTAPKQPAAPEEAPVVVPDKLPLNITLTGTMVMGSNSVAFILNTDGRTEHVYSLMDCLPSNEAVPNRQCQAGQAKLIKITGNNITVEMNQRQYLVEMTEENKVAQSPPPLNEKIKKPRGLGSKRRKRPGGRKSSTEFPSRREGNRVTMEIPIQEVEKAFENFSTLINQARVVPYMVEGEPQGFQIRKIQPGSIFERIGLKNSDILKSVNGESLTTADQALRLFTAFRNEREIALELERGGRTIDMSYIVE